MAKKNNLKENNPLPAVFTPGPKVAFPYHVETFYVSDGFDDETFSVALKDHNGYFLLAYTDKKSYFEEDSEYDYNGTLNRILKVHYDADHNPSGYEWIVVAPARISVPKSQGGSVTLALYTTVEAVDDLVSETKDNLVEILRRLRTLDHADEMLPLDMLSDLIDDNPEKFIYMVADAYHTLDMRILMSSSMYDKSKMLLSVITVLGDIDRLSKLIPADEEGRLSPDSYLEWEITLLKKQLAELRAKVVSEDDDTTVINDVVDGWDGEDVSDSDDEDLMDEEAFLKKLKNLKLDDDTRRRLTREIKKLDSIPPNSIEYYTQYNFLEFVTELPWNIYSEDNFDIDAVQSVLEADHYGIKQVKERILEFIAVQQLVDKPTGTLICLVGAPGVGKTSVAESIARATGKVFRRISLGGIRDEAEIRGHRRTYVAAMAGKIMAEIKKAGTSNPLILLDEIDKLCNDTRGDPAAALLEVLDPAQNKGFVDHFVDMPFDLSRVMFVTTANTQSTIPAPLLDRMEVIEMSGYTLNEKKQIALRYLIPKQSKANGLKRNVEIDEDALSLIITGYTAESGVRELERNIGKICRKIAMKIVRPEGNTEDDALYHIDISKIETMLGVEKYKDDINVYEDTVGVVNGLAWTSVGGEILPIEVAMFKGKEEIILTGNLGEVMKESARNALSVIRVRAEKYGIDEAKFSDHTLHISSPEGAVPKDGPSAGITLATALLSAYTDRPVKRKLAMTGELTIKGKVLPIGGLKEKLLAAKRAGMTEVIVPEANRKDISEIDAEITGSFDIIYASEIDTVFEHAFIEAAQ